MASATLESRPYGKIISFPTKIRPFASVYPLRSVEFSWPSFGNSSKDGEWLFFIRGDVYSTEFTDEGRDFYQLQQSESNKKIPIKISVYVAPYQLAELYPDSSAENLLGQGYGTLMIRIRCCTKHMDIMLIMMDQPDRKS
jgi:hypothetical protein